MSASWKPDDSLLKVVKGERVGVGRIRKALVEHKIKVGRRVITSRDPGIDEVRDKLRKESSPPGFTQWQLPVSFSGGKEVLFFLTLGEPGAVIPRHKHEVDLWRVIIWGTVFTDGKELKAGDWMFVPAGVEYSLSVGLNPGALLAHAYD